MITIPGKIPIRIHPFFWLLIVAIGWINSQSIIGTAVWAAVILVSVLIHEFGHALTAVYFKQKTQIDLVGFGGLTSRRGKKLKLWQEFLIVLNGPLAGFALCGAVYPLFRMVTLDSIQIWEYAVTITVYVNLFWTILNLLPIYPLDGGHLLRIGMEGLFGIKGVQLALIFSLALAGGLALLAFSFGWILIGAIMFVFAFDSYRHWNETRKMTPADSNETLQELMNDADKAIKVGNRELAEQKLWEVYNSTDRGVLHYNSAVYLANLMVTTGRFEKAYELLEPISSLLEDSVLPLYQQVAWKTGHIDEAAELSNRAYQSQPQYQTALLNAFIYGQRADPKAAMGWLKRAISDGLPDPKAALDSPHFRPIASSQEFQQSLQSYRS